MNPKCQTRPGFDTFSAKSADLTGLKMRRITRAVSLPGASGAFDQKDSTLSVSGTARPSALANLPLITNSNLLGCITGKSAGFSPLSTLPLRHDAFEANRLGLSLPLLRTIFAQVDLIALVFRCGAVQGGSLLSVSATRLTHSGEALLRPVSVWFV
jgi:hypothetical protein